MNAPQTVSWSPRRQLHKERNARSRLPCSTWNNALWTALRLISLKLTTEGCSWQVRRALRNTVLVSKETATGLSLGGRCRRCCSSAPTTYSHTGRKNVTECHGMSPDVTRGRARSGGGPGGVRLSQEPTMIDNAKHPSFHTINYHLRPPSTRPPDTVRGRCYNLLHFTTLPAAPAEKCSHERQGPSTVLKDPSRSVVKA